MKLTSAALGRAVILLATLAMPVQAVFAQTAPSAKSAPGAPNGASGGDDTLAPYWPFGMAPRSWSLVNLRGEPAMTVTYASRDPNHLDLIFTHAARAATNGGGFNAGVQRYCDNAGNPFLFLDGYAGFGADGSMRQQHPVTSSRLILTPQGGRPIDLIADGTYARCGNTGQPYLRWKLDLPRYRLQAWGYVTGHPEHRWYWDVMVNGPVVMPNDPCRFQRQLTAIEVQEAWWSDFRGGGHWNPGSGAIGPDGAPSGADVVYGRTDWHAKGHMPWYMVTSGNRVMCTASARDGTVLPLQQLMQR